MDLTLENKEEARIAIDTFFKVFEITCEQSRGGKKGRVKKGGTDSELLKIFKEIGYESIPWLIFGGILILEYLLSAYMSSTPNNDMFQVMEQDYSLVNQTRAAIRDINSSVFTKMFNLSLNTQMISEMLMERGVQCSSPRAQIIVNFMRLISSFYYKMNNEADLNNLLAIVTLTTLPAGLITGGLMKTVYHLSNTDFETLKRQALKFSRYILASEDEDDEVIPEFVPTYAHAPVQHWMPLSTLIEMDDDSLNLPDIFSTHRNATNYSAGGYKRRRSKGKIRTKTKKSKRKTTNKRRKINDKNL